MFGVSWKGGGVEMFFFVWAWGFSDHCEPLASARVFPSRAELKVMDLR